MTMSGIPINFDAIRSWDGSQDRAFEELCYQLLSEDAPKGCPAIRTSNPDGGVEWFARRADGSEVGWQVKRIKNINNLLQAMTESVKRVTSERAALNELTFVISINLNSGTAKGTQKSQRQKYEDCVSGWSSKIDGASRITFKLVQASDLLARLAEPRHRGRIWFWWGAPVFDREWLHRRYEEQADAAGAKYRPELQVDLPIEDELQALGFGQAAVDRFEGLRKRVVEAGQELRVVPAGSSELKTLHRRIRSTCEDVAACCSAVKLSAATDEKQIEKLRSAAAKCVEAILEAERREWALTREWEQLSKDKPDDKSTKPPEVARAYAVRQMRDAVGALLEWLDSGEGQAMSTQLYFLIGPAGSGKTHLFLDATRRALVESRPAIVLFGARMGSGNLWGSICDQLGLDAVGQDILLGAMDAAGEAAGLLGRRSVILVDALNETVPPEFWRQHLPALRAAVAKWRHIALAVSCRDTYLDVVDEDDDRRRFLTRTHPGFTGREIEATQKYFQHYGLEAPRIPLLVPEFSVPLFLRLYCESLRDSDAAVESVGHEGRMEIFNRFLDAKVKRVAIAVGQGSSTDYEMARTRERVASVVDGLIDEFATTGREATSTERGEQIATQALNGSGLDAVRVLGALQGEGVLTREHLYLNGDYQDGFRIAFQAFADVLLVQRRFRSSADPKSDGELVRWLLEDASLGILEAAAIVVPETFQIELPDLLGVSPSDLRERRSLSHEAWARVSRAQSAFRLVVETLPYRNTANISDRTVELLNQALGLIEPAELFDTMFRIAPQPDNRLNGYALHRYLAGIRMPRRDAFFGMATYHEIWDETSPISTLARWAAAGPYPDYDRTVIELACIPLMWLFSSPNRFMRDWVTKALVQLLKGHLDVTTKLVERFWDVDDPYVVQRVVVVAYGALMRSDSNDSANARALAIRIRDLVFTRPMRPDELLLDAGRDIVDLAVSRQLLSPTDLDITKRPYGLMKPGNPRTQEVLEAKYGYREDVPADESYDSIYFSLFGLADFGRYVVESGIRNFTRFRLGTTIPESRPSQPRLVKARWNEFCDSLKPKQLDLVLRITDAEKSSENPLTALQLRQEFRESLTKKQATLWDASWRRPVRRERPKEYSAELANRWVFQRTLSLGWTPRLFGLADRSHGHGLGRESHKAERWGKKYQWMAYHELLARVADNYQSSTKFDSEPYVGLFQLTGDREIDPSLPPIPFRRLNEDGDESGSWAVGPIEFASWPPGKIDFAPFAGDAERFLASHSTEPPIDQVCLLADVMGKEWILLSGYLNQVDPDARKGFYGLSQAFGLDSWLTPRDQASDLLASLSELRRKDPWSLVDSHAHTDCCFFGELGWTSHHCAAAHGQFVDVSLGSKAWPLVSSVETYTWEGSLLDCSINSSATATLPSRFITEREQLTVCDAGPSWKDASGELAFTTVGRRSLHGFLVAKAWLQEFLTSHDLELVMAGWQERRYLAENYRYDYPWEEVYSSARLDQGGVLHVGSTIRNRDRT